MKLNRILAYVMGCAAFAFSVLVYLGYIYMLGFPDGFITELGYAQRRLAWVSIGFSIVLGSCFIYFARISSREKIGKRLTAAVFVYLIFIIGLSIIDYHYRSTLMDGGGG
jgi:xanthine/uracil permease